MAVADLHPEQTQGGLLLKRTRELLTQDHASLKDAIGYPMVLEGLVTHLEEILAAEARRLTYHGVYVENPPDTADNQEATQLELNF